MKKKILSEEVLQRYPKKKGETDKEYLLRVRRNLRQKDYRESNSFSSFTILFDKGKGSERELLDWVNAVGENFGETKTSYLKRLIREDLEKYKNM